MTTQRSGKNVVAKINLQEYTEKYLLHQIKNRSLLEQEFGAGTFLKNAHGTQQFTKAYNFGKSEIQNCFSEKGSDIKFNDLKCSLPRMLYFISKNETVPLKSLQGIYFAHLTCENVLNEGAFNFFTKNWGIIERLLEKTEETQNQHLKRTANVLQLALKITKIDISCD